MNIGTPTDQQLIAEMAELRAKQDRDDVAYIRARLTALVELAAELGDKPVDAQAFLQIAGKEFAVLLNRIWRVAR